MRASGSSLAWVAVILLTSCAGSGAETKGSGPPPAVQDGNDSFATAQAVAVGAPVAGAITSATDEDWYKVTVSGAGTLTVTLAGLSADADLELYDAAQSPLGSSTGTGTATDTVTWAAPAAGTFYARVVPVAAAADYTLTATFAPEVPVSDGNDTFATAQVVALGATTAGVISSMTDEDWYRFSTGGTGFVVVTLDGLSADADLALYDESQALLTSSGNAGTAKDQVARLATGATPFRVRVVPRVASAAYALTVRFIPTAVVDGNDTFATAQVVAVGSTTWGAITADTDPDWYRFTTTGAGTVTVRLSDLTGDADLELYGSQSNLMVGGSYFAGTADDAVSYTAAGAATFNVLVAPRATVTPYSLTVSFAP